MKLLCTLAITLAFMAGTANAAYAAKSGMGNDWFTFVDDYFLSTFWKFIYWWTFYKWVTWATCTFGYSQLGDLVKSSLPEFDAADWDAKKKVETCTTGLEKLYNAVWYSGKQTMAFNDFEQYSYTVTA